MPPDVDMLRQRRRHGGGNLPLPFEARIRIHHEGKMKEDPPQKKNGCQAMYPLRFSCQRERPACHPPTAQPGWRRLELSP
jgi:hypothetical protein